MILITGTSGFIGKALLDAYELNVIGLQRSESTDSRIFSCDLTNENSVIELINLIKDFSFTHIIHTAAITPWSKDPDFSLDLKMAHSIGLICKQLKVPNLIFVSGWNVYDMTTGQAPFLESTPTRPLDAYAQSKFNVEQYFNNTSTDTACLMLRTASIYGIGQTSNGLIPNLVNSAMNEKKMILKSRNTKRDYLYIDDFVSLVTQLTSMEKFESGILNVGSGQSVSVSKIAETIKEIYKDHFDTPVLIEEEDDLQDSLPIDNQLDIRKAHSMGLLSNMQPIKIGLTKYIEWKINEDIL